MISGAVGDLLEQLHKDAELLSFAIGNIGKLHVIRTKWHAESLFQGQVFQGVS